MRNLLVLSLFFHFYSFAQSDHVQIKKEKQTSFFGNIAGVSSGEIKCSLLCIETGIVCSKDYIVDQFTIRYGEKSFVVYGKSIPDSICLDIGICCSSDMVFFTDITAFHKIDRNRIFVYPFNLTLVKDE